MKCPFCGFMESKVVDSRATEEGTSIRRRRECMECARRFTTYERLDEVPLMVVKKDGRREAFSRDKIISGVLKASQKRPISYEVIENLAREIERELRNQMEREVPSQIIGEMVMERLRQLDEVTYVRFASVYRQFRDIGRFMEELEKLLQQQNE
ncbi:MAG: transcriptional repressor NrdR [Firmicutes bacterium]|jgi:transcriptional repressor NrdR|nr:transcriptional repressor NrdR [Bacillota bacterium]